MRSLAERPGGVSLSKGRYLYFFCLGQLAVAGVGVLLSTVQLAAGRGGVRVTYGPSGWPTMRFPIARIQRAGAVSIDDPETAASVINNYRHSLTPRPDA